MIPRKTNDGRFTVRNAIADDAKQLEKVQLLCFPTLSRDEILTEAHFANHIKIFPEGQIVITDGEELIASCSSLRTTFPFTKHSFLEATDNLWITKAHKPDGDWLYCFDMGVLQAYRGLKLSAEMYNARKELARLSGMKGLFIEGLASGYQRYKSEFTIQEYCEKLKNYELTDPTISPQRKAGFHWVKPLYGFVNDPAAGNCSILMVWTVESVSIQEYIEKCKD